MSARDLRVDQQTSSTRGTVLFRVSSVRWVRRGVNPGAELTPGELGEGAVTVWRLRGVVVGWRGGVASSSTLNQVPTAGLCDDWSISKKQN